MLREVSEDVLEIAPDLLAAGPHVLKAWNSLPINFHLLREHLLRAHPQSVFAVFLPVHDEFFQRFAVPGGADDGVFVALVMAVATGLDGLFIHRLSSFRSPASSSPRTPSRRPGGKRSCRGVHHPSQRPSLDPVLGPSRRCRP